MEPLHVVCPHCNTVNRVPAQRLEEGPHCGRCKEKLFAGVPVDLSAANFRTQVEGSGTPVLVDFWAPWCGHCQKMSLVLAQAVTQLEPRVRVAKLNTEEEPALAAQFGIHGLPTLVLFRAGREVARQAGAVPLEALLAWVRQHA